MWYVNRYIVIGEVRGVEGFILTMWYVNEEQIAKKLGVGYCFILTMWYVNKTVASGIWKEIGVLY